MTDKLSTCLLALACAVLTGCASPAGSPNARGYELDIVGEEVSFSSSPLPLGEFLKLAQEVTHEVYTYDSRDEATVGPISFQGTVHCDRAEFGQFVQTMLAVKGLAVEVKENGPLRVNLVHRIEPL